ncbi:HNH endonuclease [Corynebacterium striatum]|uniref:HNH endonuclease n=1 Tax=Corynebacterium striatum TaxID=43770 RepID=UPI003AD23747
MDSGGPRPPTPAGPPRGCPAPTGGGAWVMAGWHGRHARRMTAATLARYGDVCHLCGRRGATTADHIIPRSRGGDDSLENLRPAHSSCNSSRGNQSLESWRNRHPMRRNRAKPSREW